MSTLTNAQLQAYLRIAGYAIAFFDYLQSLPSEYRLYSRQKGKPSIVCVLFVLVRYLGLAAVIIGNLGFFYHGFTPASCQKFYWAPPILKLLLYLVSQAILAMRAYAVSKKALWVRIVLPVAFVLTLVPELISIFYKRVPVSVKGSCTSENPTGIKIGSLFYVGALVFDVVAMIITSMYLWKFSPANRSPLSRLNRMLIEGGMVYFAPLMSMNIVNLIFFQNPDTTFHPAAAVLGYSITMIYSSRFILYLSERGDKSEHPSSSRPGTSGYRGPSARNDTEMMVKVVRTVGMDMKDAHVESDNGKNANAKGRWAEESV
ncbi:hypothetical protein MSAN_00595700 [Mycena sanguinolenta]|uniref:DUF6533 domain-containing protein n=1 Tax=Mycena sanguinolenta TaxID=230812 RepID=A0A8H6Z7P5_9AGAR|nr:hypothetical protein MSAN_00595700 [Mycena sanguinolenta]